MGWVRVASVRTEERSFVVSYGHWMYVGDSPSATLISASCSAQAGYSSSVRPAQIGSPTMQQFQVPARHGDEHGFVAQQALAHEAEHAGDVLAVVRVEQRVVFQGAQRAGFLRRRRHGTVPFAIIGPPAAPAAGFADAQARSAHHRKNRF